MGNLVTCQTCQKKVAESAQQCPHCGEKYFEYKGPITTGHIIMVVIIILFPAGCVYLLGR
jgi:hypothetical protein